MNSLSMYELHSIDDLTLEQWQALLNDTRKVYFMTDSLIRSELENLQREQLSVKRVYPEDLQNIDDLVGLQYFYVPESEHDDTYNVFVRVMTSYMWFEQSHGVDLWIYQKPFLYCFAKFHNYPHDLHNRTHYTTEITYNDDGILDTLLHEENEDTSQ